MHDFSVNQVVDPGIEADADDLPGAPGAAVIVPMTFAAASGFLSGLVCGGAFVFAGIALMLIVFCIYAGWWMRGVQ